jgi:hypothetical protein
MLLDLPLRKIGYGCGVSFISPESASLGALIAKFGGYAIVALVVAAINAVILSVVCNLHFEPVSLGLVLLWGPTTLAAALCEGKPRRPDSCYLGSPRAPPLHSRVCANHL